MSRLAPDAQKIFDDARRALAPSGDDARRNFAALTAKLGLERYGAAGEPFDPSVHEALMQAEPDPTASVAVCAAVLSPGFRMSGGRVLRPARVSVAEPGLADDSAPASA